MSGDSFERQISIEQQRAGMLDLLRNADMALIITVKGPDVHTRFMNMSDLELLGLTQLLVRHVSQMTDRPVEGGGDKG